MSLDDCPASWIPPLLERYRQVVDAAGAAAGTRVEAFNSLRLADALLDKRRLIAAGTDLPPQLALLGPTQSGKSTLVNVILDTDAAGVSALAGFTVHAIGLARDCTEAELAPLATILSPLERVALENLDAADTNTYVLESVAAGSDALVGKGVIWDTPDFDSIEAGGYRGSVLQAAAIADVLVFALSKDKYGDRTVWEMLALLRALGRPFLVCLNKLDTADEATIRSAFANRYHQQFDAPAPPIITLPSIRKRHADQRRPDPLSDARRPISIDADKTPAFPEEVRLALGEALAHAVADIDRNRQTTAVDYWIAAHRERWLAPLDHELAAMSSWEVLVAETLEEAEEMYATRYLNDPRKYDTFNRALAELLTLLELPGIARSLARARDLVTWPARTLLGVGRKHLVGERAPAPDQEADVLAEVIERALTRLQSAVTERRDDEPEQRDWWHAMQQAMRAERPALVARFEQVGSVVRTDFEPRIEAAAERLHHQLRKRPALLASLRAARVTTDAAGVALAVKSGGLAPTDLILAPAMLSVTTLLTEGALGRYLDTIRHELQNEQRTTIRRDLIDAVLGDTLARLARELDDDRLLSAGLDPRVRQAAAR